MALRITAGRTVKFIYSLYVDNNLFTENSTFTYRHGMREILPALEDALTGKVQGESMEVALLPENAYGIYIPEDCETFEWPEEELPEVEDLVELYDEKADEYYDAWIEEVYPETHTVLLNHNHPLAGRTLLYKITVQEVSD